MTTTTTPQELASKFAALKAPFGSHEIEWKMGKTNQEKTRGRPLPYLKFRAVADRLDEVFGETNWLATYVSGPAGGVVCRLSLRIGDEWLCKENGAGNTETEGIKGGLTDAFKRAATMWGVGRYLHTYEAIAVDIDPQTGRWAIPALPDDCLPAAEVEQRRKDAEDAQAAIQAATEAAAAAGERTPAVVASTTDSVAEPLSTAPEAGAAAVVVPDSPTSADAQAQSTASDEPAAAPEAATLPATTPDAVAPAGDEPAAVPEVAQESKVAATQEQEQKPEAKPESKAKAAATAKAAEKAEAAKAAATAAAAAEQSAEQTPPAAGAGAEGEVAEDKELTFDPATGAPVLPKGMTPKHERQVLALISRIGKPEVKLSTIREYVTGAGAATVSDIGRQYVVACLDHEQKRLDAVAAAPAA